MRVGASSSHSMSKDGYSTVQPGVRAHSMPTDCQFQNPNPGMEYYFYDRHSPSESHTHPLHHTDHVV
ncbi:hypothetical protein LSTR_LSTR009947 [Laodelphax striatellus]|uniref:Uncharacterized protein n=1 Tax=Laodelphax striatellus TaxID=195883 RepID=A0A482XGZ9_LAOST|nr:hypothetical protein LSTR_LSTR009947 [Laodelphax striatellus]